MQIKKEGLLFCGLVVISIGLLIMPNFYGSFSGDSKSEIKSLNCCQCKAKIKTQSPWNFITERFLNLSA